MKMELTARAEEKELLREISRKCWRAREFTAEYLHDLESGKALRNDSNSLWNMLRAFAEVQVMLGELDSLPTGAESDVETEQSEKILKMYHEALFEAKRSRAFELRCEAEAWKEEQK